MEGGGRYLSRSSLLLIVAVQEVPQKKPTWERLFLLCRVWRCEARIGISGVPAWPAGSPHLSPVSFPISSVRWAAAMCFTEPGSLRVYAAARFPGCPPPTL